MLSFGVWHLCSLLWRTANSDRTHALRRRSIRSPSTFIVLMGIIGILVIFVATFSSWVWQNTEQSWRDAFCDWPGRQRLLEA